ncbi:MAG: TorF family putative porin [Xanthomonadaceae bacterium]|jgi:uncharacterized protein (TIGR02001 family)|nr:TorF family putative porin [Xanthomonadaceae bacterium]
MPLSLLSAMLVVANAAAEGLSGSVALTNNYLFRGVTQTDKKPAIQGSLEYGSESGFYAGIWGSNIRWLSDSDPDVSNRVEINGYLGHRGQFRAGDIGYDIGAAYFWYPGHYPSGFNNPDTIELYAGIGYKILSAKYYYSPTDFYGLDDSKGSSALEAGLNWEFQPSWALLAQAGRQWARHHSNESYAYWKLGGARHFENGFSVEAAYHDTDLDGIESAVTLTITKSF